MEITGKVIWAGERKSGISANNGQSWASQDFVIEDSTERFPERVVVNVFGEDKLQAYDIHMGDNVRVNFSCNAREYQGKWYNDLRVWKVEKITYQRQQVAQQAYPPQQAQPQYVPQQPQYQGQMPCAGQPVQTQQPQYQGQMPAQPPYQTNPQGGYGGAQAQGVGSDGLPF